jgi:cell division protein FtsI (penicillin-binding protein 3)/stage V sporulation protein D (sporulation-specific penicillin-binding protein)
VSVRLANRRIRLLGATFALVFGLALIRAGWLQAIRAPSLDRLAASQHRETVEIPAHRGTIYDRLGLEMAIGSPAITVHANPRQIKDPRAVAVTAGHALDLDPDELYPLLADRSKGFVYVARQADPEKAEALKHRGIVGLGFYPEEKRVYPQRRVGASVIGYAGVDNEGLAGLELALDSTLSGKRGEKTIVKDPFGRTLEVVGSKPERDGHDVYLTIDHTLQGQVERILSETQRRWSAKSASAVVMDPRTGGLLALAVEPGYDANRFSRTSDDRKRNRAVTDIYEPGSTFKIVTISGALETGLVTPRTKYRLPPQIQVADRKIHDAEPRGTETMTIEQILSHSSNVGVVTIAEALGKERISEWIRRFGFGHRTGIEFPGETRGIVLPPSRWSGSTIGNVPIGQGIAVSALQMVAAYAAIANNGVWVQPHLVERVSGGRVVEPKRRRIMSVRTAHQVRRMLRDVVEEGSGTAAQVPGYRIAGKTGTAAKPDSHGGYSSYYYVGSFVGFVPAKKPRLIILVTVDEPRGAIFGGVVAAPAFAEIAKFALQYLEIPPD